jgi:hypothetical protein
MFIFYNASVMTEASVFCEKGPQLVCEEGLKRDQFVRKI